MATTVPSVVNAPKAWSQSLDVSRLLEQLIPELTQELGGKIVTSAKRLQVGGDDGRATSPVARVGVLENPVLLHSSGFSVRPTRVVGANFNC